MNYDEAQQRIFNEIANKCGLLTQYHYAFLTSDNKHHPQVAPPSV